MCARTTGGVDSDGVSTSRVRFCTEEDRASEEKRGEGGGIEDGKVHR